MSTPSIIAATGHASSGNVTSWTPFSGVSVNSGSIVAVSADGITNLSTASAGWAKLDEVDKGDDGASAIFYKTLQGTQDLVISSSASEAMTAVLLRIGNGGTVSGTAVTGEDNPPTHSVTELRDTLWVSVLASPDGGSPVVPVNYTLAASAVGADANQPSTYLAYRTNRALSENPGPWNGPPAGDDCIATWTIALNRPRRRAGRVSGIV